VAQPVGRCAADGCDGGDAQPVVWQAGKPYVCDPKQEVLRTAINSELDDKKRLAMIHDLIALQHEEAINLFLIQFANLHGMQRNVQGFVNTNQYLDYHEISFSN